jgi:peptidoglycan hydrolase-like protein with peptidoglycan-binding domain
MAQDWPLVQTGSAGEDVKTVQYLLNSRGDALSVDGDFGARTAAAVRAFQVANKVVADGIVGNQTWPLLIVELTSVSRGDGVMAVQSQIASRRATDLAVDGIFGPETENAVRQFQTILELAVDGVVGPMTWNDLVNGFLLGPDASAAAQGLFQAWTRNDANAARRNASPGAVAQLFTQRWTASAGWEFMGGNGAAGHIFYTWRRSSGTQLVLAASDGPAGYFYVDSAAFD